MKRSLNIFENDFTGISFHGKKRIQIEIEVWNYPFAVMGAGTMWRGIAQVAAAAGHPVMLYDVAEKHTQNAI